MLYDVMTKFSDKSNIGKTVKIRAEFGAVYNYATNTYINVIEQYDATACCAAYYEIRLADGIDRPAIGSKIEMVGVFESGYIKVNELTLIDGEIDNTVPEIDAANMPKAELISFLSDIKSVNNEHKDKTVRICGHYGMNNGLSFIVGYKQDTGNKVKAEWNYELHSDNVELPTINDTYIHTYEVIGTVSSYKDSSGGVWPCIEVKSIRPITTYLLSE